MAPSPAYELGKKFMLIQHPRAMLQRVGEKLMTKGNGTSSGLIDTSLISDADQEIAAYAAIKRGETGEAMTTPIEPASDLLPCPFCGGTKFRIEMREWRNLNASSDWYHLKCDGCFAKADYPTLDGLTEKWNTRALAQTAPAEVAGWKPLNLFHKEDDEAIDWVSKNLSAIRRDNGSMEYTLMQVVRAFQAGRSTPTQEEAKEDSQPRYTTARMKQEKAASRRLAIVECLDVLDNEPFQPHRAATVVLRALLTEGEAEK